MRISLNYFIGNQKNNKINININIINKIIIIRFEWGKNKLIIYDIAKNKTNEIQLLDADFKIPAFSRSIMLKNGMIYLLGGE